MANAKGSHKPEPSVLSVRLNLATHPSLFTDPSRLICFFGHPRSRPMRLALMDNREVASQGSDETPRLVWEVKMSKITMSCTVAISIAALFVLMGPASWPNRAGSSVGAPLRSAPILVASTSIAAVRRSALILAENTSIAAAMRSSTPIQAASIAGTATCPRSPIAMAGDPAIPTGTSSCQLVQESGTVVAVNSNDL